MSHGFVNIEDPHGRWWRHVRFHRWWSSEDDHRAIHVGGELVHGPKQLLNRLRLKVSTTGEETLDVAYGLGPILRHYWDLDLTWGGRLVRLPRLRFDVALGLTGCSWCFGPDDGSWSRDASWGERLRRNDLRWFRFHWYRRHVETITQATADVPLPEGPSTVTIDLERSVWGVQVGPYRPTRRMRHPQVSFFLPGLRRTYWHADVKSEAGLPVPGKGENSWDCGPDAIYGSHFGVRAPVDRHDTEWVGEALAKVLQSVLRQRARYGSSFADTGR